MTKEGNESRPFREWLRSRVEAEQYWFHRIELAPGLVTPGWSNPEAEKLPYFGLPKDMRGMRVLDVGTAEGFFAFEAERRGAEEVVAVDSFPDSVRRFNICRDALGSKANAYLCNVYDLTPKLFGTFDMVFFFGVLYHLRHPLLALEKLLNVCCGTMLMQTATYEHPAVAETPMAKFHPFGSSSTDKEGKVHVDPTIFWLPNRQCVLAMVESVGFVSVATISTEPFVSLVVRAQVPVKGPVTRPDQSKAPWS